MTDRDEPRNRGGLFAEKGSAKPAPAVGFMSVWQLQGNVERRRYTAPGSDGAEQRPAGPSYEELLYRQRMGDTASAVAEKPPPVSASVADNVPVGAPVSGSGLGALIQRRNPVLRPPEPPVGQGRPPAPELSHPAPPAVAPKKAPTRIDPREALAGSVGGAAARRRAPAAAKSPTAPAAAEPSPPKPKRKIKRKKMTVRLTAEEFAHLKELTDEHRTTFQSVMEAAIVAYAESKR